MLRLLADKNTTNRAIGCYFDQYKKKHRCISTFGMNSQIGFGTTLVLPELLEKLITEEDLDNCCEKLIADDEIRFSLPPFQNDETSTTRQLITEHQTHIKETIAGDQLLLSVSLIH